VHWKAGFSIFGLLAALCFAQQADDRVEIMPRAKPATAAMIDGKVRASNFRVDANLVEVPVRVTDRYDYPIMGLGAGDFKVWEDEAERPVVACSGHDSPLSIGFVFDSSRSMKGARIQTAVAALQHVLDASIEGDEFVLARFSDAVEVLIPSFTPKPGDVANALGLVAANGWTALIDAVITTVHLVKKAHHQPAAIFVVSDGTDNNSRYSESQAIRILREANVQVYAIGIIDTVGFLKRAATETGGAMVKAKNINEIPAKTDELLQLMRNRYLIGYYPPGNDGGQWRRITVKVPAHPEWRVDWRRGYQSLDAR